MFFKWYQQKFDSITKNRWFTSIAPISLCNSGLISQWRSACIKSRTCLYNPLKFKPVLDRWANLLFFSSKTFCVVVFWYACVCVKSSGIAQLLANARLRGSAKFANALPSGLQGGQMLRSRPVISALPPACSARESAMLKLPEERRRCIFSSPPPPPFPSFALAPTVRVTISTLPNLPLS